MLPYIALVAALGLSGVAAFYSIIGLTAIFAGAFWPIILMGGALEVAKVVTACFLHIYWYVLPKYIKPYLVTAVIALVLITSMGIYGFLSRAHIDHTVQMQTSSSVTDKSKVEVEIISLEETIKDYDKQIKIIDDNITKLTSMGHVTKSLRVLEDYRGQRSALVQKKNEANKQLIELKSQVIVLESETKRIEAEVGPVKFIASLIFDEVTTNELERAVRWVIIVLVFVFDPLAVCLVMASSALISQQRQTKSAPPKKVEVIKTPASTVPRDGFIEVEASSIVHMK